MIGTFLACAAVLAAFFLARRLAVMSGGNPFANPILVAALLIGLLLWLARIPIESFMAASWPLRWALGPAIVALGHLIYERRATLAAAALPVLVAVTGGSLVGILSAVWMARLLGLDPALVKALAPKSVTSPFAIALMERLGGSPALAAGLVIVTGIIGAVLLPPMLRRLRLGRPDVMGVAVGQTAHIVGTEALTRQDPQAAAFSGVTMVLAGVVTAILLPLLWPLLF